MTQQEAAEQLHLARTTVVALEKGERRVRPTELLQFAQLYGVPVSDLVRARPSAGDFVLQFRTLLKREDHPDRELEQKVYEFQRLCEDYLELEKICQAPLRRREPAEYDLLQDGDHGIRPEEAGEELAVAERKRLGLGDGPIPDLRYLLENEVGMRIFLMDLPSKLAAMFAYTEELGGCIAVNVKHPAERRRTSIAHECAHFLTNRSRPEFTLLGRYQRLPASERLANAFAVAFLLPELGLRVRFHAIQRSRGGLAAITPADLLTLADYYGVSLEALTLRLEDLSLLPPGTWDALKASGLRVREAQEMLDPHGPARESANALPLRYQRLAVMAYQRDEISQGRLAKFLHTDYTTAWETAERLGATEIVDDEGRVQQLPLDLGEAVGASSA